MHPVICWSTRGNAMPYRPSPACRRRWKPVRRWRVDPPPPGPVSSRQVFAIQTGGHWRVAASAKSSPPCPQQSKNLTRRPMGARLPKAIMNHTIHCPRAQAGRSPWAGQTITVTGSPRGARHASNRHGPPCWVIRHRRQDRAAGKLSGTYCARPRHVRSIDYHRWDTSTNDCCMLVATGAKRHAENYFGRWGMITLAPGLSF